jgi:hypothetical protein
MDDTQRDSDPAPVGRALDPAKLVGTREAAAAIGVHAVTLRRWKQEGHVRPAWQTPTGTARWDIDDLRRQVGLT